MAEMGTPDSATGEFLSCDWGTTSFRLRWVAGADCRILREIRESAGVKALHEQSAQTRPGNDKGSVFGHFLRDQLDRWATTLVHRPLPLVISGMASSSVGWVELPYAPVPFPLDGRGLGFEQLQWDNPKWVEPTYLISGIATRREMMRGEETEIIGLMQNPALNTSRERSLLILPGTHSKHVRIQDDAVVDFRTFMTGELFDVLGRHSLLRASVNLGAIEAAKEPGFASQSDRDAFAEGVLWAKERGLAGGLFRVRTRAVLESWPMGDNAWFFNGLLIGSELREIGASGEDWPLVLAANRRVSELYALSLEILFGKEIKWSRVPVEQVERATVLGHALFLKNRLPNAAL